MEQPRTPAAPRDHVNVFVEQVLRTGLMLSGLLADLLEDLPSDTFGGEDVGEVLLEMLTGTVRPAADAAGIDVVRQATALLGALADRTLADLEAAAGMTRARR